MSCELQSVRLFGNDSQIEVESVFFIGETIENITIPDRNIFYFPSQKTDSLLFVSKTDWGCGKQTITLSTIAYLNDSCQLIADLQTPAINNFNYLY